MRKPYFVSVVVGIALLVVVVGFFFMQQTIGFMSQITQATTSIFSSSQATSTTSIATSTASTTALVGSGTTKVITKVLGTVVHSGTGALPKIQKFEPAAATVGSTIVITGTGFAQPVAASRINPDECPHHSRGAAMTLLAHDKSGRDLQICRHILNVLVVLKVLHQPQRLLRLVVVQRHRGVRDARDLRHAVLEPGPLRAP